MRLFYTINIKQKRVAQTNDIKDQQAKMLADIMLGNQGVIPPQYLAEYPQDVQDRAKGIYESRKQEGDWRSQMLDYFKGESFGSTN